MRWISLTVAGKCPGTFDSHPSTWPVFPRLPPSHLPLCSACSGRSRYYQRRTVMRRHLHDPQSLGHSGAPGGFVWGAWCLLSECCWHQEIGVQTVVKAWEFISSLDVGGKEPAHCVRNESHGHFPDSRRSPLLSPLREWRASLLSFPYLVPWTSRGDCLWSSCSRASGHMATQSSRVHSSFYARNFWFSGIWISKHALR